MTDYEYYIKHYSIRVIPESAFCGAVNRARVVLDNILGSYKAKRCAVAEELALYRMAEEIYWDDQRNMVRQSKVGNVSVTYADTASLKRRLYEIASSYLRIYRGVAQ